MVENGLSIRDMAEELCITYAGAYNKIRKNRDFSEDEIYVLFSMFGKDVFFNTVKVRKLRANGSKKTNRVSRNAVLDV